MDGPAEVAKLPRQVWVNQDNQQVQSLGPLTFPSSTLNNEGILLISAGKPVRGVAVRTLTSFPEGTPTIRHLYRRGSNGWLLSPEPLRVSAICPRNAWWDSPPWGWDGSGWEFLESEPYAPGKPTD